MVLSSFRRRSGRFGAGCIHQGRVDYYMNYYMKGDGWLGRFLDARRHDESYPRGVQRPHEVDPTYTYAQRGLRRRFEIAK